MATINRVKLRRIPVVEKQTSSSRNIVSEYDMIRMKRSIRSKMQQNKTRYQKDAFLSYWNIEDGMYVFIWVYKRL